MVEDLATLTEEGLPNSRETRDAEEPKTPKKHVEIKTEDGKDLFQMEEPVKSDSNSPASIIKKTRQKHERLRLSPTKMLHAV
jgi:hypothetical protein